MTNTGRAPAAWYPDPTGRHQHRFWDGERWTIHVLDNGAPAIDDRLQQPPIQQQQQQSRVVTTAVDPQIAATSEAPASWETWAASWATTDVSSQRAESVPPARSSKTRAWIVAAAVVVAVLAAGLTVTLAFGGNDDRVDQYPAAIETNFISGCTEQGARVDYCRCALDRLKRDYDLAEFAGVERSYLTTGKLPDEMMAIVQDCLSSQFQHQA